MMESKLEAAAVAWRETRLRACAAPLSDPSVWTDQGAAETALSEAVAAHLAKPAVDAAQMDALIEGVMDISAWYGAEGGTLGRLERAKAVVEALAHFAAPALGKRKADRVASALLVTLDDAVAQIQQDDAFCKDVARKLASSEAA